MPLLMIALLPLAACVIRADLPEPWQYRIEPLNEQVERNGCVVAEICQHSLSFSGPEQAQAVNAYLLLCQGLRLAEYKAWAERYLEELEFNGVLLEDRIFFWWEESCHVFYNDGAILSITMELLHKKADGANPATHRYAYNFDAATGELLTLEHIWGEQAYEQAAAKIYAEIEQSGLLDNYYADLEYLLLHNLHPECWYMDDKNIYIIYDTYSIAPYAAGTVEFKLAK